jgi:hypothetical protein
MSALDAVRKKFGTPMSGASKASKSPSAGSAGSRDERFQLFESLEPRIRAMAARWQYTAEDLHDTLRRARLDPEGWERAIALDERKFGDRQP